MIIRTSKRLAPLVTLGSLVVGCGSQVPDATPIPPSMPPLSGAAGAAGTSGAMDTAGRSSSGPIPRQTRRAAAC
jgi:hypothetical protein